MRTPAHFLVVLEEYYGSRSLPCIIRFCHDIHVYAIALFFKIDAGLLHCFTVLSVVSACIMKDIALNNFRVCMFNQCYSYECSYKSGDNNENQIGIETHTFEYYSIHQCVVINALIGIIRVQMLLDRHMT